MSIKLFPSCLIVLLVMGCSNTEEQKPIDYDTLPELNTDIVMETKESEEYIPGMMADLVVTSGGAVLVFDSQQMSIEQFSPAGEHLASVARQGNGPGEISSYVQLFSSISRDTLIVRPYSTGEHHYYSPDDDGIYRYRTTSGGGGRLINNSIMGHRNGSELYITRRPSGRDIFEDPYINTVVSVVDSLERVMQDSIHTLRVANAYAEVSSSSIMIYGTPPYQYSEHFSVMGDGGYLIARAGSSLITFYDQNYRPTRRLALTIKRRRVTDEDLEYRLGDRDHNIRTKMEDRVGEYKPPFTDIWAAGEHLWLLTDERKEGKEFVVLTMEGEPLGKFLIPPDDTVREIRDNRLYAIHQHPEIGYQVRAYEVDL